jgi:acetyl esterase/lipase
MAVAYVIGTAAQDDSMCRRFAQRLGIPVVAIDYRLAPKHPYTAALEDCYEALTWLSQLSGIDPTRIIIGGASAGGGLTAALALLARDRGEVAPLFQLLVYPTIAPATACPMIRATACGPRERTASAGRLICAVLTLGWQYRRGATI